MNTHFFRLAVLFSVTLFGIDTAAGSEPEKDNQLVVLENDPNFKKALERYRNVLTMAIQNSTCQFLTSKHCHRKLENSQN